MEIYNTRTKEFITEVVEFDHKEIKKILKKKVPITINSNGIIKIDTTFTIAEKIELAKYFDTLT